MNQRGQFTLPLLGWVAVAAGVAFVGMSIALKVQSSRLESCKTEAAAFKAQVKAEGDLAIKQAKAKEAQDAKQIKDALTQRDIALAKLRSNSSRSRNLSASATAPAGSQSVCLGSTAYNAALERYRGRLKLSLDGIAGLATEGDAAQIDAAALIQAWPLKMATEIK